MLVKTYTELAQELYAAFSQGEVEKMLSHLADNVCWEAPAAGTLPWSGSFNGKEGFMEWLEVLAKTVDIQVFEPREYVEQGGKVVAFVHIESVLISNGRRLIDPEVHFWTFEGDKVVKFEVFNNTAALEAAFREE